MNKKYLKENNLLEAHKQFMKLCEWSYVPQNLSEDDDNEDMPQDQNQQDAGQDPMMVGGDMPQGEDQVGGGDMTQDSGQDPMIGGDIPVDDQMMGDGMGEDEEVIDVEDITNAQEKTNDKVNLVGRNLGQVDDKIESLMQALSKMEVMINKNNDEIANFKQEFEKRNPTQTEKLNLRSLDSYPFNVNPKDYWEKKGIDPNSNYSGYSDNDEPTTKEYEITNIDVDDFDERSIADSFNIADDLNQDIKKIFGL